MSHANTIQIKFVLTMERAALHPEFQHRPCDIPRHHFQDVQIRGWPRKSIDHSDDESSHAMYPDFGSNRGIELMEKGEPWFGDPFNGRRRQDVPLSNRSADSNARRGVSGIAGAKLF